MKEEEKGLDGVLKRFKKAQKEQTQCHNL